LEATKLKLSDLAKELGVLPHQLSRVLLQLGTTAKTDDPELSEDEIEAIRDLVADDSFDNDKVYVAPNPTVRQLAKVFDAQTADIQKKLMEDGILVGLTQKLKPEVAEKIADYMGYVLVWEEAQVPAAKAAVRKEKEKPKPKEGVQPRPPIVTILGHVDHGKTSLLDYIRKAGVVQTEFGGITQHIGAYQAEVNGKKITFLDTPGHEAFTAMRARGAQVTDIAVLVVAADDGIMPQTREAIDHAKNAGVPIIVAVNKVDKPEAQPDRVKQQLTEFELVSEEWGGDTIVVNVSALTGEGIPHLLEMILLVAEVNNISADPKAPVDATIVEARLDKGRGPVATVLIHEGTLRIGDSVAVQQASGRIKAMMDHNGQPIRDAGPGTPVEILGLNEPPEAGDKLKVYPNERSAKNAADEARILAREAEFGNVQHPKPSLQDLMKQLAESNETKNLNIILRADVRGSVEAVAEKLNQVDLGEVKVRVISSGVGSINDNDVLLARASNAICVAFNTTIEPAAKKTAKDNGIDVRRYNIIYELLEDLALAAKGRLTPKFQEVILGKAEIRRVYKLSKGGTIAGCMVVEGKITRNAKARVLREGLEEPMIWTGDIDSLKHIKEDVREMAEGFECGIQLTNFTGIKEGDIIVAFIMEQINAD